MHADDDLIPLSALQHYVVCPRQCALIHLEQLWVENARTAEGRIAHERVDRGGVEWRDGLRRTFGVELKHRGLGLVGKADAVEFHPGAAGVEVPFPVEHKRGRPKTGDEDRVQLCAQGLCLEEMLGVPIPGGALFYGEKRRRLDVAFDAALRARVVDVAAAVRALFDTGVTPVPPAIAPCEACSLEPVCRPDIRGRSVACWLTRRLTEEET